MMLTFYKRYLRINFLIPARRGGRHRIIIGTYVAITYFLGAWLEEMKITETTETLKKRTDV